ncbi:LuxR C-terminal-related transcriptional regulator [Streptomyces sp. NPDC006435]|uniref:LuxR C-terminal-related transcriptional regulator n=1 Tax=Streptomyces sp. NPDC006435 TaxID=3154300 RepID=UPI0033A2E174
MDALRDGFPQGPDGTDVDPVGDPFLRTRFVAPARPATFLRRERLTARLGRESPTPLTVVEGCAGAGKTLLVADWAGRLDPPAAWLTVDPAIRTPDMFWAHFRRALRVGGAPMPSTTGPPAPAGPVDHALLSRLAAELDDRDRPVTVVVDEFDRANTPEIARQLAFVLRHGGSGLHLVLITRTEPLLPLHRYRVADEMTEIRDAELAFTTEEAAALLRVHGLDLPVRAVDALVERTRGWAAGLRLCALAARLSPDDPEVYLKEFEAGRSTIADFLLAEVLERQPPRTQDLLLRVSVLDRFRPGLADALTGRRDAAPILAALVRDNAFVEDFGHTRYRLHPLFREILLAHLRRRSPGLERQLHRRAAQWLWSSGMLSEALAHGAAAEDGTFVAEALVHDLAIGRLLTGPRPDGLTKLFTGTGTGTGTEAERAGPATDLVRAACELSRHDLDRGLEHLRHAEEQLASSTRDGVAARLGCALLEATAGRLTGSAHQAEEAARTASALLRSVPAALLDQHPELWALLQTQLGSSRLWAGRLDEARAALDEVSRGPGTAAMALPRRESSEHLAFIDYLDGWPGRAEHRIRAAAAEAERFGLPRPPESGLVESGLIESGSAESGPVESGPVESGIGQAVLAAVAVERDETDRAQALLDRMPDTAAPDPVTAAGRHLARARLLLAQGHTRAALDVAERTVPADEESPWARAHAALVASTVRLAEGRPDAAVEALRAVTADQPTCLVGAARAHLAAGDRTTALRLLDDLPGPGRTGPAVTVRAALVRAQAAKLAGDLPAVHRLLDRALRQAEPEGLRRPFLEAGPWLAPFLATAPPWTRTDGRPAPASVRDGDATGPDTGAGPPVEPLSERERDVLRRLARTMSTEDIAADLYVSVNTVKTHLKSAYRKLSVHRRNDAVRRARDLGLL